MFNIKVVSSISVLMLIATVGHAEESSVDFTVPTAYSKALMSQNSRIDLGSKSKWHPINPNPSMSISEQGLETQATMQACVSTATDDIIIPLLNDNGYNVNSIEELVTIGVDIQTVMSLFDDNDAYLDVATTTYGINCMRHNGYQFLSSTSNI